MNQEVIRIYTPISADLCIATPHAKVKGKNSYAPLQKEAQKLNSFQMWKKWAVLLILTIP